MIQPPPPLLQAVDPSSYAFLLEEPAGEAPPGATDALLLLPRGAAPTARAAEVAVEVARLSDDPARAARVLAYTRRGLRDLDRDVALGLEEAELWRAASRFEPAARVLGDIFTRLRAVELSHPHATIAARHRALIGLWALEGDTRGAVTPPPGAQLEHLLDLGRLGDTSRIEALLDLFASRGWSALERDRPLVRMLRTLRVARRKRKAVALDAPAFDPGVYSPTLAPLVEHLRFENIMAHAHSDLEGARAALAGLLTAVPEHLERPRWILAAAQLALDGGDLEAARGFATTLAGDPRLGYEGRWLLALTRLVEGDLDGAIEPLTASLEVDAALPRSDANGFTHALSRTHPAARALYWIGRVHELQGRVEEATVYFRRVAARYPHGIYALMAGDGVARLGDVAPAPPAAFPAFGPVERHIAELASRPGGAAPALLDDLRRYAHPGVDLERTALGRAPLALIWWRYLDPTGDHGFTGDAPAFDDVDPRPHLPTVSPGAKAAKLDPWWVLALIRQESRFKEAVCSGSGACGLMQIKPRTAAIVAKRNDIPYETEDALRDPALNLALGCALINDLEDIFEDDPVRALMAYNAGAGAAGRWNLQRWPTDLFLELAKDRRTRAYTIGIIVRYGFYAEAFGAQGRRRTLVVRHALNRETLR